MQNLLAIQQVVDLKPLRTLSLDLAARVGGTICRVMELDLRRADLPVLIAVDMGSFDVNFVAIGHLEICPFDHHGPLVDEIMEVLRRMQRW